VKREPGCGFFTAERGRIEKQSPYDQPGTAADFLPPFSAFQTVSSQAGGKVLIEINSALGTVRRHESEGERFA